MIIHVTVGLDLLVKTAKSISMNAAQVLAIMAVVVKTWLININAIVCLGLWASFAKSISQNVLVLHAFTAVNVSIKLTNIHAYASLAIPAFTVK